MPVMNGYDATKKIRRMDDPQKANIPIVAMTANAFSDSDASEKQMEQRIMPDITWHATLRGGVHGIKAIGTLSIKLASEEE